MSKAVFDVKTAGATKLRALDSHCKKRTPDGWSKIDPERSHLNEVLIGSDEGVMRSLKDWYERTGTKKPAKQAEEPFYTLVLSASPEHFKDGDEEFIEQALAWLREELGDDVVYAEIHRDETTPHIHVVVAPTYEKKKRIPGRRKKDETEEEFEARRQAARDAPGVRTVSRTKHHWQGLFSYDRVRQSYSDFMKLEYGERHSLGTARETKDFVKEQFSLAQRQRKAWNVAVAKLRARHEKLDKYAESLKKRAKRIEALEVKFEKAIFDVQQVGRRAADAVRGIRKVVPGLKPSAQAQVEKHLAQLNALQQFDAGDIRPEKEEPATPAPAAKSWRRQVEEKRPENEAPRGMKM